MHPNPVFVMMEFTGLRNAGANMECRCIFFLFSVGFLLALFMFYNFSLCLKHIDIYIYITGL